MACNVRDITYIAAMHCEISQCIARALQGIVKALQGIVKASQRVVSLKKKLFDWLIPQHVVEIRQCVALELRNILRGAASGYSEAQNKIFRFSTMPEIN